MENRVDETADVVLVGGGIMSATVAMMLSLLEPDWTIVITERASRLASESSDPWNNAGTGHAGFCELNYMPDPADDSAPADISRQFHLSRQWWASLVSQGILRPDAFIHPTPHINVVFGDDDCEYLHQRYRTLIRNEFFAEMEYTENPDVIAQWAPLVMDGRVPGQRIAATRHRRGVDVDFGSLTRSLIDAVIGRGGRILLDHNVTRLERCAEDRSWTVGGYRSDTGESFTMKTRFVFVGSGGTALRLLREAGVPQVCRYGVLPVGASFLRCSDPLVVRRHDVKVYGRAVTGAPPMSLPHMDKRVVDGKDYVLFGPYATWSTRLLKYGGRLDFFATIHRRNIRVLVSAAIRHRALVRYLITELTASRSAKFAQLRRYYPNANPADWERVSSGQRAQLVVADEREGAVLKTGTELVVDSAMAIAGLVGASPGASTAVSISIDFLRRVFPDLWADGWAQRIEAAVPGLGLGARWSRDDVRRSFAETGRVLGV